MIKKEITGAYFYITKCENCKEDLPNFGYTFEHVVYCPKCHFPNTVLKDIEYIFKEEEEESILPSKFNIIALIGKSGSGKSTILKEFTQHYFPRIFPITQATTRPRRFPSESGYIFYDNEEWDKLEKQKAFVESTIFNNWHYGTLISSLVLGSDNWNIGIFSPAAIKQLLVNSKIDKLKVFEVCTDAKTRMERNLNRENTPNVSEICRRILADEEDFKTLPSLSDIRLLENNKPEDIQECVNAILKYTTGQERE